MRFQKIILVMMIMAMLGAASADGLLSAEYDGGRMSIAWDAEGSCVLTVYRNGWPVSVSDVDGASGGIALNVPENPGTYSVRLQSQTGCWTINATQTTVIAPTATATPTPTVMPVGTAVPTPVATPGITASPMPMATPVITAAPIVSAAPSFSPTVRPGMGSESGTLAAQVVNEVNAERAKYGLAPLTVDEELTRAACVRAQEIVEKFSHTRPDGTKWSTVSTRATGENIAKGHNSADRVMAAWMTSEGHRENILRQSFGSIGVCALEVGGVIYWVQLFGR